MLFFCVYGDNYYPNLFALSQLADSHYKTSQGEFSTSSTTGNSHFPHLQNLSLLVMNHLSDPAHSEKVRLNSRVKIESSGKVAIITVGEYINTKDSHEWRLSQGTELSDLHKYCMYIKLEEQNSFVFYQYCISCFVYFFYIPQQGFLLLLWYLYWNWSKTGFLNRIYFVENKKLFG